MPTPLLQCGSDAGADDAEVREMAGMGFEPIDVLNLVPADTDWAGRKSPLVSLRIAAGILRLGKPDLVEAVAGLDDGTLRDIAEAMASTGDTLRAYSDLAHLALDRLAVAIASHAVANAEAGR
ncbi:MAG: hypothetical protein PGN25_05585 [Methylorubrum populi]